MTLYKWINISLEPGEILDSQEEDGEILSSPQKNFIFLKTGDEKQRFFQSDKYPSDSESSDEIEEGEILDSQIEEGELISPKKRQRNLNRIAQKLCLESQSNSIDENIKFKSPVASDKSHVNDKQGQEIDPINIETLNEKSDNQSVSDREEIKSNGSEDQHQSESDYASIPINCASSNTDVEFLTPQNSPIESEISTHMEIEQFCKEQNDSAYQSDTVDFVNKNFMTVKRQNISDQNEKLIPKSNDASQNISCRSQLINFPNFEDNCIITSSANQKIVAENDENSSIVPGSSQESNISISEREIKSHPVIHEHSSQTSPIEQNTSTLLLSESELIEVDVVLKKNHVEVVNKNDILMTSSENTQNYSQDFETQPPPMKPKVKRNVNTKMKSHHNICKREIPIMVCDLEEIQTVDLNVNWFAGIYFDKVSLLGKLFVRSRNDTKQKYADYQLDDNTGTVNVHFKHHNNEIKEYQELVKHFEGVGDCLKKTHFHKGSALSFAASQIKNNIKSVSDYIPSNTSVLVVGKPYYFKDDDKVHIWAEMIYIIDEKDQRLEIAYKEFLAKTYKNIFLKDA